MSAAPAPAGVRRPGEPDQKKPRPRWPGYIGILIGLGAMALYLAWAVPEPALLVHDAFDRIFGTAFFYIYLGATLVWTVIWVGYVVGGFPGVYIYFGAVLIAFPTLMVVGYLFVEGPLCATERVQDEVVADQRFRLIVERETCRATRVSSWQGKIREIASMPMRQVVVFTSEMAPALLRLEHAGGTDFRVVYAADDGVAEIAVDVALDPETLMPARHIIYDRGITYQ